MRQDDSSRGSMNSRDMRLPGRPSSPGKIGSEGFSADAIYLKEGKMSECCVARYVRRTQRLMSTFQLQPLEWAPIAPLLSECIRS